jgi:hypothetical protein
MAEMMAKMVIAPPQSSIGSKALGSRSLIR